jgi:hypothetical protein
MSQSLNITSLNIPGRSKLKIILFVLVVVTTTFCIFDQFLHKLIFLELAYHNDYLFIYFRQ